MAETKFSPTNEEVAAFQSAWHTVDDLIGGSGEKGTRTMAGLTAAFNIHDAGRDAVIAVLGEYGQAFRGDWSEIDGRAVRSDMELLASSLEGHDIGSIESLRQGLGLCPLGKGHWEYWCSSNGCDE